MGKGDQSSSASHGPQDTSQQQISNIPAMFQTSQEEGPKAVALPNPHIPLGGSCPIMEGMQGTSNGAQGTFNQAPQAKQPTQPLCLADLSST